jgi:anhydro-N-acetylmuramic acid kinase
VYCIGLMSGTSVDGIDAVLVNLTGTDQDLEIEVLATKTHNYPSILKEKIIAVSQGAPLSLPELAQLDDAIATQFALAAIDLQQGYPKAQLIGSHGQTVFHRPPVLNQGQIKLGYSLQLGRGEVIAKLTETTTISNFRVADLAIGGQGAPLVPKVDAYLFNHPTETRCIQNIGGIGNLTYIPATKEVNWEQQVCGWDTGPGNSLLDLAVHQLTGGQQSCDHNGSWAAQGTPSETLVEEWLQQDFFQQRPPKSTGRELFGQAYLQKCYSDSQRENLSSADWLATLTELTVRSIVHSYSQFLPKMPDTVLICGGGSRNLYLKQRLQDHLAPIPVLTTDEVGISSIYKEAIAFAILAYWRLHSIPGNLPQVTGAKQATLLGEIHQSFS